jgi:hypothetical protein
MGQYYNIIIKVKGSQKVKAYDRHIDGEYTMAKLMEHSWYLNPMVNAVSEQLYRTPSQIAWVGDYANESELYKYAYPKSRNYKMLSHTPFNLGGLYLVNHTKKLILNCWEYLRESIKNSSDGWVIHPLPLLTAIGNGLGGGDYHGINEDKVGIWAWDMLEIVEYEDLDLLKKQNYENFSILFLEN